jgi:hypothetical protein
MLNPRQDWFYSLSLEVLLEFTIPFAVFMNAMGTEFRTMIQDKLPHGAEPPISFYQFIHYQLAFLGIDILELPAGVI